MEKSLSTDNATNIRQFRIKNVVNALYLTLITYTEYNDNLPHMQYQIQKF